MFLSFCARFFLLSYLIYLSMNHFSLLVAQFKKRVFIHEFHTERQTGGKMWLSVVWITNQRVFSCALNKITSASTWSSAISRAERKERKRGRERRRDGGRDGNRRSRNWITGAFSHYHLAIFYGPPVRDDVPMTPHNTQAYYSILPRWNSCK